MIHINNQKLWILQNRDQLNEMQKEVNISPKNNKLEFAISFILSTIVIYYLSKKFFYKFNVDIIINNFKFSYIIYTIAFYSILLFIKFKVEKALEDGADTKKVLGFIYLFSSFMIFIIIDNVYATHLYGDEETGIQKYGSIYEYVDEKCTPLKRYIPFILSNKKVFWNSVIRKIDIELEDINDSYAACIAYEKRELCSVKIRYFTEWLIFCKKIAQEMKK